MSVRRRLVVYVQGYDPRGLPEYYRMFRQAFRNTCALYGLTGTVGKPVNDRERFITEWSVETEKNRNAYSASPVLAGGKVYVTREDAKVFVVDTKTKKVVGANEMEGEFAVATPAFVDGTILIRTLEHLYCIGK